MSKSSRNAIRFLARRMTVDPTGKGIARPVVRIAEGGVAVGVALIIMSLAIVQGFQRDVRELVVGFGAIYGWWPLIRAAPKRPTVWRGPMWIQRLYAP